MVVPADVVALEPAALAARRAGGQTISMEGMGAPWRRYGTPRMLRDSFNEAVQGLCRL